jgi:tripartite-type tricarboxylate transporter receptor subunit TctC
LNIVSKTLIAAIAIAGAAHAENYPTRPVTMVVPFGPGTSTDVTARVIANTMSKSLGQPVIVENKPGAGGTIGTDYVAKSKADGYTLTFGSVGTFAINKALYSKLPHDPVKDFTLLSMPGYTPTLLVVRADAPYKTLDDLVQYARQNPDKVAFSSAGNGTSGHLAGELLKTMADVSFMHVPYKQGGQALMAAISGEVDFMFYHPVAVMPHVKAGKLRALASSSANRAAAAPDVPTIAESGYPGFNLTAWYMLAAPAGIPADVKQKLVEASKAALQDPAVKKTLVSQGIEGEPLDAPELPAFINAEAEKWAKLVKQSDAQID